MYQSYQNLPFSNTFTGKYVGGYFYFSAFNYFYKTYSNFGIISSYKNNGSRYRQIAYDSATSKFYVGSEALFRIDIFDSSCFLLQSISLASKPYGLVSLNGNIYASLVNSTEILVIQNGMVGKYFTVNQCLTNSYQVMSITTDSFGNLAISCSATGQIVVYDSNGNYMNTSIQVQAYPYISAIDSYGRFVVMTHISLEIYT